MNKRIASSGFLMLLMLGAGPIATAQPPHGAPPPPEVSVLTVSPATVPVSFSYVGVTEASKVVEVRSRIQGFLETRDFEEGAWIEAGTRLFTVDARSFEADLQVAQAQVEQAESRVHLAEQEVKRLRSVTVPGAIAESDLDKQVAEVNNATALLRLAKAQLAKAQLELGYTKIDAPLTGFIDKAEKEIGSLVDAGQNSLLTRMRQVDPMYVSFSVSEREFLAMRDAEARGELVVADGAEPYLEITLLDGKPYKLQGKLNFESSQVDINTGTVELRGDFQNPDQFLKPGQFVKARIGGWIRPNTITVPQRAVSQSPQGAYVYVVGPENKAELRIITPGEWVGKDWIVQSGLKEGEQVVVEGITKVQPGIVVVPMPADAQANAAESK